MGCPVLFLVQKERERENKNFTVMVPTLCNPLLEVRLLNPSYVVRGSCRKALDEWK